MSGRPLRGPVLRAAVVAHWSVFVLASFAEAPAAGKGAFPVGPSAAHRPGGMPADGPAEGVTAPPFDPNPALESQTPLPLRSVGHHVYRSLDRLAYECSSQLQFPFRYARSHPVRFLLGVAGFAALVSTDHRAYKVLVPPDRLDRYGLYQPATTLSRWGNTRSAFPLVLGIGAIGVLTGSQREHDTSVMLIESLITAALWTEFLKTMSGRERPREREALVSDWDGPPNFLGYDRPEGEGFRSFPSGHSTGIWAVATILAGQYPRYKIVPVLAYGTATAMSYSRMVVGAHWFSDVVVGALIGYGCARQVLSTHRSAPHGAYEPRLRIGVDVSGERKGIGLAYLF